MIMIVAPCPNRRQFLDRQMPIKSFQKPLRPARLWDCDQTFEKRPLTGGTIRIFIARPFSGEIKLLFTSALLHFAASAGRGPRAQS